MKEQHHFEEIGQWLKYVYDLQFAREEDLYERYLYGKCVMRKLRAELVVLGVLRVPRCHAHMLVVYTRITFSDLQQLSLALFYNNINMTK